MDSVSRMMALCQIRCRSFHCRAYIVRSETADNPPARVHQVHGCSSSPSTRTTLPSLTYSLTPQPPWQPGPGDHAAHRTTLSNEYLSCIPIYPRMIGQCINMYLLLSCQYSSYCISTRNTGRSIFYHILYTVPMEELRLI